MIDKLEYEGQSVPIDIIGEERLIVELGTELIQNTRVYDFKIIANSGGRNIARPNGAERYIFNLQDVANGEVKISIESISGQPFDYKSFGSFLFYGGKNPKDKVKITGASLAGLVSTDIATIEIKEQRAVVIRECKVIQKNIITSEDDTAKADADTLLTSTIERESSLERIAKYCLNTRGITGADSGKFEMVNVVFDNTASTAWLREYYPRILNIIKGIAIEVKQYSYPESSSGDWVGAVEIPENIIGPTILVGDFLESKGRENTFSIVGINLGYSPVWRDANNVFCLTENDLKILASFDEVKEMLPQDQAAIENIISNLTKRILDYLRSA